VIFELDLAFRFLRTRRRSLARFTSVVAVVGIAAGVASFIFAQALARGFQSEMQEKILANTAHVSVFRNDGSEIGNWKEFKDQLSKIDGVNEVTAVAYENAILTANGSTHYAVVKASASDPSDCGCLESTGPITISVGLELAIKAELEPGLEANLVTFVNGIEPKTTRIRVRQTFKTGLFDYDSTWINTAPSDFAVLYGQKEFVPSNLSISLNDIYRSNEIAEKMRNELGKDYRVLDWQEANRPLFTALSLERRVALAVILLIILIAALNITTTLAILVNERRPDIAILRTCGTKTKSLVAIFLLEGIILAFVGIVSGLVIGLTSCYLANYFNLINISADVYSISHITLRPGLADVLLTLLIATLTCLAATLYPVFKASKIKPLEILRNQ
jgi:lipoprotein-releasing system permease protein